MKGGNDPSPQPGRWCCPVIVYIVVITVADTFELFWNVDRDSCIRLLLIKNELDDRPGRALWSDSLKSFVFVCSWVLVVKCFRAQVPLEAVPDAAEHDCHFLGGVRRGPCPFDVVEAPSVTKLGHVMYVTPLFLVSQMLTFFLVPMSLKLITSVVFCSL